jgi:hypothetical protein
MRAGLAPSVGNEVYEPQLADRGMADGRDQAASATGRRANGGESGALRARPIVLDAAEPPQRLRQRSARPAD